MEWRANRTAFKRAGGVKAALLAAMTALIASNALGSPVPGRFSDLDREIRSSGAGAPFEAFTPSKGPKRTFAFASTGFLAVGPAAATTGSLRDRRLCLRQGESSMGRSSGLALGGGDDGGATALCASVDTKDCMSFKTKPSQSANRVGQGRPMGFALLPHGSARAAAAAPAPPADTDFQKKIYANAHSIDTVLKGVQVGHGIHYSIHPRPIVSESQSALAKAVRKIHDAGRCAASGSCLVDSQQLDFTLDQIVKVRHELTEHHKVSEKKLSALGQLLIERFTCGAYTTSSLVTAQLGMSGDIFTLTQMIPNLNGGADSELLASQQLREMSVEDSTPVMVDHSLEYQADEWNEFGVHRVIARARPGKDLWMVIADSLFGFEDSLPDVKHVDEDMYHLKIVVEDSENAMKLHRYLRNIEWTDSELREKDIPIEAATREVVLVEESTHTAQDLGHMVTLGHDATGDRTSVVNWSGAGMQIRIQTLDEHYAETEMISMMNRERLSIRKQLQQERLASVSPLYGFTRNIMKWMLTSDAARLTSPPSMAGIQVNFCA